VKVMTLCLQPHHWYYVHGVRVHNKGGGGCFLKDTEVTLDDGSRKQLKDIAVGDRMASWDEAAQRRAVSTVKAKPVFRRPEQDLVRLFLPSATIHATEDHPFWSRGRRGLVSLHPNSTRAEYGLAAELLGPGEELEGEAQEPVSVLAVERVRDLGAPATLKLRQLRGGDGANAIRQERTVEVMTLCLEPHHWFYARGVRVHNKGCFAPWTPILMADGAHRAIDDVRVSDKVMSWDERAGKLTQATIIGVDAFPPRSMLEVCFSEPELAAPRQLRASELPPADGVAAQPVSLIVTRDHPIYSAQYRGLVSMEPNTTLVLYSMAVGQMGEQELLHHHLGHHVPAAVRQWEGKTSKVMTLRLDRHHWFYAHGVRVHNKGSGGGSGGGGSSGGRGSGIKGFGSTTRHTSSTMGARPYAAFILLNSGTRRRRNVVEDEEDSSCKMADKTSVSQACSVHMPGNPCQMWWPYHPTQTIVNGTPEPLMPGTVGNCCQQCLDCPDEACMNSKQGCQEFLNAAFPECEEKDGYGWMIFLIVLAVLILCGAIAQFYFMRKADQKRKMDVAELAELATARCAMGADQGRLPANLVLSGTYSENGETKTTTYTLVISDGMVSGNSQDDDGTGDVTGKVDGSTGEIKLQESYSDTGIFLEIHGRLSEDGAGGYSMTGEYLSNRRTTRGVLNLKSAMQGSVVCAAASTNNKQVVEAQVVGQPFVPGKTVP